MSSISLAETNAMGLKFSDDLWTPLRQGSWASCSRIHSGELQCKGIFIGSMGKVRRAGQETRGRKVLACGRPATPHILEAPLSVESPGKETDG
jgi:hypothetical protein